MCLFINNDDFMHYRCYFGTQYSWEKTNNFIPKITAKQLVINILRTFRPSTGAIFNANNVPQTGWLATTPY